MFPLALAGLLGCGAGDWTTAESLTLARYGHSATLLDSGDVLVVGGIGDGGGALPQSALWHAEQETWYDAAPLERGRAFHTATRLTDGRVFVVGGAVGDLPVRETAIFDPDAGTWSPGPELGRGRVHHTATLLADGSVLVHGGHVDPLGAGPVIWTPGDDAWTELDVPDVRQHHGAVVRGDGILVVGGVGPDAVLDDAHVLTPAGMWADAAALPAPRAGHALFTVADAPVLAGGASDVDGVGQSGDVLRLDGGSWVPVGALSASRTELVATPLGGDGAVLLTGGRAGNGASSAVDLFDPRVDTTVAAAPMATGRLHHTATRLDDGRVLVAGGFGGVYALDHVEIFRPAGRNR